MTRPGRALRRLTVLGIGIGAATSVGACATASHVPQVELSPVTEGAVEVAADGRLILAAPWIHTSPARADSIAMAAARFKARMGESEVGTAATIDYANLRVCGRKYYVLAIAGPVPHRVARPIRLAFGPRWVVPLCSANGESPVSVEVADGESALEINPGGEFASTFMSDGEYGVFESDSSYDAGLPLSPEQAASFAIQRTGRRAKAAPVAIMIHPGSYGNRMPAKCMRWKVLLDSPMRLRGQYGEYNTSEVYVRRQRYCSGPLVLQVADGEQPDSAGIEYPVRRADGSVAVESVRLPFVLPAAYDSVAIIRP